MSSRSNFVNEELLGGFKLQENQQCAQMDIACTSLLQTQDIDNFTVMYTSVDLRINLTGYTALGYLTGYTLLDIPQWIYLNGYTSPDIPYWINLNGYT